ncbi:MAG TPA: hypothetical protein VGF77_08860 [Allosphingosinicella sp.]|jgi:hypothetical protein
MIYSRLLSVALVAAGAAGLAACDQGHGYGGVDVGYGAPAYGPGNCDPYWGDCYGPGYDYAGYYGDPWWGWYGDFYYPGFGFFVFDRHGHRHRWNDDQRHHWEGRRGAFPHRDWSNPHWQNWSGFHQGANGRANWGGGNPHANGGNHAWGSGGGHRSGGGSPHAGGAPHVSGGGHVSSGGSHQSH